MNEQARIIKSVVAKRRSSACFVNFTDGDSIVLSTDIVVKYRMGKDIAIDEATLNAAISEQKIINLKQSAYIYAAYKPRSIRQVAEKLRQLDFEDEYITIALEFLASFNLLDDEKFALMYCKDYLLRKSASKSRLKIELLRKGISKDIASKVLDEIYPDDNEYELALKAAWKKDRSLERKAPEKRKNSLFAFLFRQGFNSDVIKKVVDELSSKY